MYLSRCYCLGAMTKHQETPFGQPGKFRSNTILKHPIVEMTAACVEEWFKGSGMYYLCVKWRKLFRWEPGKVVDFSLKKIFGSCINENAHFKKYNTIYL